MAMIKCKECGNEYSDQADKCPHCGAPSEKNKAYGKIYAFAGILILIAIICGFMSCSLR